MGLRIIKTIAAAGALAAVLVSVTGVADATERRFTYAYGSGVLMPGAVEFEPWTTARIGHDGFYDRFDERLELEVGLTERLQSSWYLNFEAVAEDVKGVRETSFAFHGVSWEWKLKLLDPVADPVGLALYWELSGGPSESELEAKLILDKRVGRFLAVFNLVGEYELEYGEPGPLGHDFVVDGDLGAGFFLTPALFAGLEVVNHNHFSAAEGFEHSVLFAGPTVSWAEPTWWAALTILPQLGAFHGATSGIFSLEEHERIEARLLIGIRL